LLKREEPEGNIAANPSTQSFVVHYDHFEVNQLSVMKYADKNSLAVTFVAVVKSSSPSIGQGEWRKGRKV